MMKTLINIVLGGWILLAALPASAYVTGTPVPTDSRIKTFVYNANDVYRVLTHYGYQMNIEFGDDEEIETVSVGDRTGWQITPTENRLFVRAMEDKAHTNMTVITDQRTYQFDLYSAQPGQQGWDELVYVVRFYYPPENANQFASAPASAGPIMAGFPPAPMNSMPSPSPMPMMQPQMQMPSMAPTPLPSLPPLSPPPMAMPAPMLMPQMQSPAPQMPMMTPQMQPQPQMQMMPPMSSAAPSFMPPMGQPLYSPALPPVAPPPMASPYAMSRPATPVPDVNVNRKPFGMIVPPHVAVAPPPRMPHPRSPFIVNEMGKDAQELAREYPHGSYRNPMLAPRRLPSLERVMRPQQSSQYSSSQMNVSPMGLPLPSTAPGSYIQF